jgi:hypothetical protein
LKDLLELHYGLLDYLLDYEVISRRQYAKIKADSEASLQCARLLRILTRHGDFYLKDHHLFLRALRASKQEHVANYIENDGGELLLSSCFFDSQKNHRTGDIYIVSS